MIAMSWVPLALLSVCLSLLSVGLSSWWIVMAEIMEFIFDVMVTLHCFLTIPPYWLDRQYGSFAFVSS